jgi:hypothetical protein
MKFSLWTQYGALNSTPVFSAFRRGAVHLGHKCVDNDPTADVDVIWSVLWQGRMRGNQAIWQQAQANNKPVIVLEVGALRRGTTWKVALGGVNGSAYFGPAGNDSTRAKQLNLSAAPWRPNAQGPIIICTQHSQSLQWQGQPSTEQWVLETIDKIRAVTDRLIAIRPHPRSPFTQREFKHKDVVLQQPRRLPGSYDDYDLNLTNAWAVVNWSSNPGVQSVLQGIPAFVGPHSLASPVANINIDTIESPHMPNRDSWLNDLAYTEWTVDEIAQGLPLERLTNKLV